MLSKQVATKHDIQMLKHAIEVLKRDLTLRLGGMMAAAIGTVAVLVRLL